MSHAAARRAAQVLKLKAAALKFLTQENDRHLIEAQTAEHSWDQVTQHESELSELLQIICGRRWSDTVPEAVVMASAMRELAQEVEEPSHLRRQAE